MTMSRRIQREDPAYLQAMREAKELFDAAIAKNSMKGRGRPAKVAVAKPAETIDDEVDVSDVIDEAMGETGEHAVPPAETPAPATTRAPGKSPVKSAANAPAKATTKSPAKSAAKAPAKATTKSPAKSAAKSAAKSPKVSKPAKKAVKQNAAKKVPAPKKKR